MSVVEFQDIRRAYEHGQDVLDGVSFSIEAGEVVGLLGRNGAGKTTLLRIAMGLLEPQHGRVRLFGDDPRQQWVAAKQRIGYVSEDQILPQFLSVQKVLELHRTLFPDWDNEVAAGLLARFELPVATKIKNLSKGQARQVALICAVAHRPELLILDEPAGGLDPAARREFLETSIQLLNATGSTILFSSHHMTDVERVATRVVMIHAGRLLLDDQLDSLREAHCLALVPDDGEGVGDRLAAAPACLGTRRRSGSVHGIFGLDANSCRGMLESRLGIKGARCTTIGLEEMFIELVGGDS